MNTSAPLANLITLGARDLPALRNFYRALGWPQIMDDGEFVVFELRGIVLALFPLAKLARDGNTDPDPGTGGIRFTIGVMVDSADEVDRLTEQMRAAGARVTKEPVDAQFFTGRSAYLCDPEGNYFEIAWADMPNNPIVIATRRPPAPEQQRSAKSCFRKHGHSGDARQPGGATYLRHGGAEQA